MKDLIRSYVNISPKGQKKVPGVFTRIPKRTTGRRRADHGHRNTGGELEPKIKAMSKWEIKSKQLKGSREETQDECWLWHYLGNLYFCFMFP